MVTAGDFRNGLTFEDDGVVLQIIEFQHVKPGKGAAFVRTKLRNVITGAVIERTFNPTDKVQEAKIDRKSKQYLYKDDDFYNFMDPETYEQDQIAIGDIEDAMKFVKENENVMILSYKGKVFSCEPPLFVELEITETEPGFAGNTAQGATKPAIVETGAQIKVPLFINQGEIVRIDTRSGEYMERVKN